MPISDPNVISFSNNKLRPLSNWLAATYTLCASVVNRWNSLGAGAAALAAMQSDLGLAANNILQTYLQCYWAEKLWFGVSFGGSTLATLTPNTVSVIQDGAGSSGDSRPIVTGANATNLITRAQQFQNWLLSATQSFTDGARGSIGGFNTVLQVSGDGPTPIVLGDAGNFVNRCNELKTNYEAGSNANLNTVLAYAPNPTQKIVGS